MRHHILFGIACAGMLAGSVTYSPQIANAATNPSAPAPGPAITEPPDTVFIPPPAAEKPSATTQTTAATAVPDSTDTTPAPRKRGPWVIGFGIGLGGDTHEFTLTTAQNTTYGTDNGFTASTFSLYMRYELSNQLALGWGYTDRSGIDYDFWSSGHSYELAMHGVNVAADYFLSPATGFVVTGGGGVMWTKAEYVKDVPDNIPSQSDVGPWLFGSFGYQFRRGNLFEWRLGVGGELFFYNDDAFNNQTPYAILADFQFRWRL